MLVHVVFLVSIFVALVLQAYRIVVLLAEKPVPGVVVAVITVSMAVAAVACLVDGDTVAAALAAAFVAFEAWDWWRRNGRKTVDRVIGIVTDLGHRLAVVNIPEPTGGD